jgi:hypothetical protein
MSSRLLLLWVAAAGACDPPAEPPAPSAPASVQPRVTLARDLDVQLSRVARVGDVVVIEVALSQPLPPLSNTRPSLHIGDEVVRRSRAGADGRADRLRFTVPADQFERMSPAEPIVVRAGFMSNERSVSKPTLAELPLGVAP